MTNELLTALTPDMRDKLVQYINAKALWITDPMKQREECRSYAAEFVHLVLNATGADALEAMNEVTHGI